MKKNLLTSLFVFSLSFFSNTSEAQEAPGGYEPDKIEITTLDPENNGIRLQYFLMALEKLEDIVQNLIQKI